MDFRFLKWAMSGGIALNRLLDKLSVRRVEATVTSSSGNYTVCVCACVCVRVCVCVWENERVNRKPHNWWNTWLCLKHCVSMLQKTTACSQKWLVAVTGLSSDVIQHFASTLTPNSQSSSEHLYYVLTTWCLKRITQAYSYCAYDWLCYRTIPT